MASAIRTKSSTDYLGEYAMPTIMLRCRFWMPFGLALAVLTATACTPPESDEPDVALSTADAAEETPSVAAAHGSNVEQYLQRLEEPSLSDSCSGELASYRFVKINVDGRVASVRIWWADDWGSYRSVFSASPDEAISSDGMMDERMWNRIEAEIGYSDYWNLETVRNVIEPIRPSFFLEGCRNGEYHWVHRQLNDNWLSRFVPLFTSVGKLEWLESG